MSENENIVPVAAGIMVRKPKEVLAEAVMAAEALAEVIKKKVKPVIFNGEQYLEFEDWQTCAKFYNLSVRVIWTRPIEIGGAIGFEAGAEVVNNLTGMIVSAAEAMCLNDEDKWSKRTKYEWVNGKREKVGEIAVPLFQLRSMAQTRACAKAFRNVLAWVVVLAGFKATPAEEMTGMEFQQSPKADVKPAPVKDKPAENPATTSQPPDGVGEKAMDVFDTLEKELAEFCDGNSEKMQDKLQAITSFPAKDRTTKKLTGEIVPGVKFVADLRMKGKTAWAGSALEKLRNEVAGER
jgi:hypothetical protein